MVVPAEAFLARDLSNNELVVMKQAEDVFAAEDGCRFCHGFVFLVVCSFFLID